MGVDEGGRAGRRTVRLAVLGALIAIAADVLYAVILSRQGIGDDSMRSEFVGTFVALMAGAALITVVPASRGAAPGLLVGSATGLLLLGVLAMWSIGLLLVVAGVVIAVAAAGSFSRGMWESIQPAVVGCLVAFGLLVAGLYFTDLPVRCPTPNGSGGGGTLMHGGYSYTCVNGVIRFSK